MAIFSTPAKSPALERRLTELDQQRRYLAQNLGELAQPWTGALRRLAAAEATVGSTSIEGYGASIEDTVEILAAYGQAMDRVTALADDPHFEWTTQTILELHFLVCFAQPDARPGRLRD